MKTVVLLLLLLSLTINCAAQETCQLESKDAPTFFGLKLGMTQEQVRAALNKEIKFKSKKTIARTFFQNFVKKPPPEILRGVRAFYLRFFGGELYQIEFFYDDRAQWQTLTEFSDWLSATQSLPKTFWINQTSKNVVKCVDFTLVADKVLNPRIELTDEAGLAKFAEWQKQQQQKKP